MLSFSLGISSCRCPVRRLGSGINHPKSRGLGPSLFQRPPTLKPHYVWPPRPGPTPMPMGVGPWAWGECDGSSGPHGRRTPNASECTLSEILCFLWALFHSTPQKRKDILTYCSPDFLNVLKGTSSCLPLNTTKSRIKKIILRLLADRKVGLKRKRQVLKTQTGGILPRLLV